MCSVMKKIKKNLRKDLKQHWKCQHIYNIINRNKLNTNKEEKLYKIESIVTNCVKKSRKQNKLENNKLAHVFKKYKPLKCVSL